MSNYFWNIIYRLIHIFINTLIIIYVALWVSAISIIFHPHKNYSDSTIVELRSFENDTFFSTNSFFKCFTENNEKEWDDKGHKTK